MTCSQCEGCGRIDDGEEGIAWTHWEALPPGSDIAVKMGLVRPIRCPKCDGLKPNPQNGGRVMPTCDSCLQTVPNDWPHSCYRACRGCRTAIEPGQDYCGACRK